MFLTKQIAKSLRDVHSGGNWTDRNLKDVLVGITWQQATTKVDSLNTIATLVYHMNYYVGAVIKVLEGGPLDASDKYSFAVPDIKSEDDWKKLCDKAMNEAEKFASLIEHLPDSMMEENFIDPKYGNWYRNLTGIVEHTHYHLGQIALLKKILQTK